MIHVSLFVYQQLPAVFSNADKSSGSISRAKSRPSMSIDCPWYSAMGEVRISLLVLFVAKPWRESLQPHAMPHRIDASRLTSGT
jgi:hypothetical protein